jgi:hypothetical protein
MSMKPIAALFLAFTALSIAETYPNVDYLFKADGTDKIEIVSGSLTFDSVARTLIFTSASKKLDVPAGSITSLSYERASKPRYAAGVLQPVPFRKSKQHYLTIQYTEDGTARYAFFRLGKRNYSQVMAAAEAATGKTAKRETQR